MARTRVMTPEFRLSYPYVFEPQQTDSGEKYTITMLFDTKVDLSAVRTLIKEAIKEKYPSGKLPPNFRIDPLRDGSEKMNAKTGEAQEGYDGMVFASASSKIKPGVVSWEKGADGKPKPLEDQATLYGGCYARATLTAFCYDVKGNRGVALGLQNIQKLPRYGDPFSGRAKAEDDFVAIEDAGDNDAGGMFDD